MRLSVQEALKERTKKRLTAIAKFVGVIAEIEDLESSAEHPSLYALSKIGGQRSDSSMLRSMDGYVGLKTSRRIAWKWKNCERSAKVAPCTEWD